MASPAEDAALAAGGGSAKDADPFSDHHYWLIVKAMAEGRLVPFLGAGASLCGRPNDVPFKPKHSAFLPRSSELARHLISEYRLPWSSKYEPELVRVSQRIELIAGREWLYEKLHELFAGTYEPNTLHAFLAHLPRRLFRDKGRDPRYQLIVTTNYDDALERAFDAAKEPYHLVWYLAEGDDRGHFMHRAPNGDLCVVPKPNEYVEVSTSDCTVILKIHGAVTRAEDWTDDSYVITEDHYIEFLTGGNEIGSLVPIELAKQLRRGLFLFLGYSLRDWNLRVILHRIWRDSKIPTRSWAIQKESEEYDIEFWNRKNVGIRAEDLSAYVAELDRQVTAYSDES